jgi:hypothetical protein
MTEQVTADEYSATISVDSVVTALEWNATHGADDRVIAVPRKQDGEASVRRDSRGSERYGNHGLAPVYIRPEDLVDDGFERPPTRGSVELADVPREPYERTDEDEDRISQALGRLIEVWRSDVRSMARAGSTVELYDHNGDVSARVTVVGVEE